MYSKIVAGTDFSKTAKIATDRASLLASRLGAELFIVHAGSDPKGLLAELGQKYKAETTTRQGNPPDVLVEECERVGGDLLVVGSVGMSGAKRFMLGNVPNKVSHHALTDLLIVKTDPPPKEVGEYDKVLVGTDGSPTATRAVDMAAQLASTLGITPTIVCAYEPPTEAEMETLKSDPSDPLVQWKSDKSTLEVPAEFRWRIAGAAQAEDVLERAVEHVEKFDVKAEARAVEGAPADALISLAETEDFDLIVVGSVGMSGAKRFMLGNVPHRISHHSPVDVLILHTTS